MVTQDHVFQVHTRVGPAFADPAAAEDKIAAIGEIADMRDRVHDVHAEYKHVVRRVLGFEIFGAEQLENIVDVAAHPNAVQERPQLQIVFKALLFEPAHELAEAPKIFQLKSQVGEHRTRLL